MGSKNGCVHRGDHLTLDPRGYAVLRRVAVTFVAALTMMGALSVAAPAANASSGSFVSRINAARRSAGRPGLSVRSDLAAVAYRHSQRMAAKNSLYHNPNLGAQVSNWQAVGENVGRGGDVASLHQAFMNSPTHRANILDRDYTEVGVGVVVDGNGIMWVTEVFRRPMRAQVTRKQAPRKPSTTRRPTPTRTTRTKPARRPASRPKPAAKRAPKPAPRAVDRSAVLRARLAALAAQPPAHVAGTLPKALSYLEVMSALGR